MAADLLLESESRHLGRPQRGGPRWPTARTTRRRAISLAAFACADAFSEITADADPDAWRHRLHLGPPGPPLPAPRPRRRPAVRDAGRLPRALSSSAGSLTMADGAADPHRRSPARGGPRLARRQLEAAAAADAWPRRRRLDRLARAARPGSPRWSTRAGRSRAGRPTGTAAASPTRRRRIVEREFAAVGAPGTGQDRTNLWANTALAYASADVQAEDRAAAAEERSRHVPALFGARRRLGPRRHPHPRRPPGRPLRRQRPEGLDLAARPPPTTAC